MSNFKMTNLNEAKSQLVINMLSLIINVPIICFLDQFDEINNECNESFSPLLIYNYLIIVIAVSSTLVSTLWYSYTPNGNVQEGEKCINVIKKMKKETPTDQHNLKIVPIKTIHQTLTLESRKLQKKRELTFMLTRNT